MGIRIKHKVSNLHEFKLRFMRKYYFLLGLSIFLLIFSKGQALVLNFTGSSPVALNNELSGIIQHISTYYDGTYWYVIYYENSPTVKIAKYTSDFSLRLDGWDTITAEAYTRGIEISENPYNSSELYVTGFTKSVGTQCQMGFGNISKSDLSIRLSYKNIDGGSACGRTSTGVTELGSQRIFLDKYASSSYYMAHTWFDALGEERIKLFPYYSNTSDNYIPYTPPQLSQSTANGRHPFIFQVYNTGYPDELWTIYQSNYNGTWSTYLQRYNWLTPFSDPANWKGLWRMSNINDFTNNASSVFYEPYSNMIYSMYKNDSEENQYVIKRFDVKSTIQTNSLIEIDSQTFNLTDSDTALQQTGNYTNIINLYYNGFNYYLFYGVNKGVTTSLRVLKSAYTSCTCTDWINTSLCSGNLRKQTRICYQDCDIEENWFSDSSYCQEGNATEQYKYFPYYNCIPCEIQGGGLGSDLLISDYPSMYCETPSYLIPSDAYNVSSNAILSFSVISTTNLIPGIDSTPNNNYKVIICNPLTSSSCQETTLNCKNNKTWTLSSSYSYLPGSSASANLGIQSISNCRVSGYGYYRYSISGELCIFYSKKCGEYKCSQVLNKFYENAYDTQCDLINSTICPYQCDYSTGRCVDQSQTTTVGLPSGILAKDPFSIVIAYTDLAFTGTFKMLLAVIVTSAFAIYGVIQTKKTDIGIGIGMGFTLFFMALKWFPPFFAIVWVLSLAFLLGKRYIGFGSDK